MRILALIPARGGSKRLPGKNVKVLGDLPLIAWSIRSALQSGVCDDVVVSTDDAGIAAIASQYGAHVPGLRPAELASDTAGSVDVALHALERHEAAHGRVDGLLLLQPTSPFRSADTIRRAAALFESAAGLKPVASLSPADSHPAWCFRVEGSHLEPFLGWEGLEKRSQDLEPAHVLNGAIYLISPARLRAERSFLSPDTLPLLMPDPIEGIDIDTELDWAQACAALPMVLQQGPTQSAGYHSGAAPREEDA